jgi:hypothetical protein
MWGMGGKGVSLEEAADGLGRGRERVIEVRGQEGRKGVGYRQ